MFSTTVSEAVSITVTFPLDEIRDVERGVVRADRHPDRARAHRTIVLMTKLVVASITDTVPAWKFDT